MFDNLGNIAWGVIVFGVVVVIGSVIVANVGSTVANCNSALCGTAGKYNLTTNVCSNATDVNCGTPTGTGYTTANYLNTQLGSTSGGLASYTPLIIISIIGFAILGMFFGGRKY